MNKSQTNARKTRFLNHIKKMSTETTYEKQAKKKKSEYYDARKRVT